MTTREEKWGVHIRHVKSMLDAVVPPCCICGEPALKNPGLDEVMACIQCRESLRRRDLWWLRALRWVVR
jgi:hypothetical protein